MLYTMHQITRRLKEGKYKYNSESIDTWTVKEKSRFIESCWIGLPVVNDFVFLQLTNGGKIILHGSKRIKAIQEYINNSFKLEGLKIMTEFNGKSFEELTKDLAIYQTQLEDMYIDAITVEEHEYGEDYNIYKIRDRMNMETEI